MKARIPAGSLLSLAVLTLTSAGCAAKPGVAKPAAPAVVSIVARDFGYDLPPIVPAGVTTIEVVNRGQELHHMQIVRLQDGHSADEMVAAFKQKAPPPAWVIPLGGPNGIEPGKSARTIQTLTPGHYAVICFIPGADSVPHFMKGMSGSFEVVASAVTAGEEPTADATFTLSDYAFGAPTILAGDRTIRVENSAQQPHELVLVRLAPGKKVGDMLNWFVTGGKGEAPGHFVGGVAAVAPGEHTFFTNNFEPGEYGLLCFVDDMHDGKPHAMHGMMAQFTVPATVAVNN